MHQILENPAIHGRNAISSSGSKQGQRAVAHPHRRVGSRRIDLQRPQNARGTAENYSSVSSRRQAEFSPYCRSGSTQKAMQRTMQACRVLSAATAAALALHTAPAYATQASRPGGTLTVDRAWMEELLMSEMDTRISNMTDDELVAAFKEVLSAKMPVTAAADHSAGIRSADSASVQSANGPLSSLQQLSAKVQGLRLYLPWQQAPLIPESSSNASIVSKMMQDVGAVRKESAAAKSSESEASTTTPLDSRSGRPDSKQTDLKGSSREEARKSNLESPSNGPMESIPDVEPSSFKASALPEPSERGETKSWLAPRESEKLDKAAASEGSSEGLLGRSGQDKQAQSSIADEGADQTGSLLEAFGLPLQLQEDDLPEIAPASPSPKPGLEAAGNILRSAVAAASGAAAAAGERLKGLLPGSQESQPLPSIDIPESVGQGAIVAGTLGALFLLSQILLGGDESPEPGSEPVGQEYQSDLPDTQVSDGSGNSGILSSAAASFQLLPTLLGFRIPLTASDAAVPLPSPMPASRQVPPRDTKLSYKGAMLNGLQASRNLHSAQPSGDAPAWQGREPDQGPPGPPASADPAVLWQRSPPLPESASQAGSEPSLAAGESSVLWRRDAAGAPASIMFPKAQEDSRAPKVQPPGQLGQAMPPQRHVSRQSALLDNVAPAGADLPKRLPNRQHANGSRPQSATRSGYSQRGEEPSSMPEAKAAGPPVQEEDPWRPLQGSLRQENAGTDSPEHWIAMHQTVQQRGQDPWKDEQSLSLNGPESRQSLADVAGVRSRSRGS